MNTYLTHHSDSAVSGTAARASLERYYRVHAHIYDVTRWSFLFGRTAILKKAASLIHPEHILEIGCGTGKNLRTLCRLFPQAHITGVDMSEPMLQIARKKLGDRNVRVTLLPLAYAKPLYPSPRFDLIVCSYSLSMFNPGWEHAIEYAYHDLSERGLIAVVDFYKSRFPSFTWWMGLNHVRMEGHLLPALQFHFQPKLQEIRHAYGGLWHYVLFLGEREASPGSRINFN